MIISNPTTDVRIGKIALQTLTESIKKSIDKSVDDFWAFHKNSPQFPILPNFGKSAAIYPDLPAFSQAELTPDKPGYRPEDDDKIIRAFGQVLDVISPKRI